MRKPNPLTNLRRSQDELRKALRCAAIDTDTWAHLSDIEARLAQAIANLERKTEEAK